MAKYGSQNITLLRLVVTAPPGWFYPQDWYYDEEFANTPLVQGLRPMSSAQIALQYLRTRRTADWLSTNYWWTDDKDDDGNKVYIGGWNLGKGHKGLQIHRHLANPKVSTIISSIMI